MIQNRKNKKDWIITQIGLNQNSMCKRNINIYIKFTNDFEYRDLNNNNCSDELRLTNLKKYKRILNSSENHLNILLEELVKEGRLWKEKITYYDDEIFRSITSNIYRCG